MKPEGMYLLQIATWRASDFGPWLDSRAGTLQELRQYVTEKYKCVPTNWRARIVKVIEVIEQ